MRLPCPLALFTIMLMLLKKRKSDIERVQQCSTKKRSFEYQALPGSLKRQKEKDIDFDLLPCP